MDSLGVSLIPGIVPGTLEVAPYTYVKTKYDSKAKEYHEENVNEILVKADTVYTWVNDVNHSESIVVSWGLVGQQADASQIFGSGELFQCSKPAKKEKPAHWPVTELL